jgi:spore coat polysaccharide biosynthesis protein SpsF
MKIGALIQARFSSMRLPRKVLKELPYGSGITVLEQVLRRLKKISQLDSIVVATTTSTEDNNIVSIAERHSVQWYRGSEEDVLARYYLASKENGLDIVVRITADCPCIDPEVVDSVIERHISTKADFTSNVLNRTFPHGLDTEVINFDALEKAHFQAGQAFEREHVCPYIYKTNPQMFKISSLEAPAPMSAPDIRVTLDTEDDYTLLCALFDYLYPENEFFGAEDIVRLFREKPWLKAINEKVTQKRLFDSEEKEVKEAVRILDLQELKSASKILVDYLQ